MEWQTAYPQGANKPTDADLAKRKYSRARTQLPWPVILQAIPRHPICVRTILLKRLPVEILTHNSLFNTCLPLSKSSVLGRRGEVASSVSKQQFSLTGHFCFKCTEDPGEGNCLPFCHHPSWSHIWESWGTIRPPILRSLSCGSGVTPGSKAPHLFFWLLQHLPLSA